MEPKRSSPESFPSPSQGSEYQVTPEQAAPQLEKSPEPTVERAPEQHQATTNASTVQVSDIALPTPVVTVPATDDQAASSDDTPLTAGDDDVIEKEWVDKAKQIISETKDDPYKREKEVGKLQNDYLRKRYGKELGAS